MLMSSECGDVRLSERKGAAGSLYDNIPMWTLEKLNKIGINKATDVH